MKKWFHDMRMAIKESAMPALFGLLIIIFAILAPVLEWAVKNSSFFISIFHLREATLIILALPCLCSGSFLRLQPA